MQLTWLDSNSWLIEVGGETILLDPWLEGSLVFGNMPWLFKGNKNHLYDLPEKISLILLSQGLEDHTHPPTLKALDHTIPVVGSVNAAKVATELNYQQITALKPEESFILNNKVEIRAFAGSVVGPQSVENAYLITDLTTGYRLYYEPHGYHSPAIKSFAPVDVVLVPIVGLSLLGLAPILRGQQKSLELCQWLQPKTILPTSAAAQISYEGIIANIVREDGSIDAFRQLLAKNQLTTEVITPKPGEKVNLSVYV
jgi:L-ascorbate metabolism protein UlaG (beta-lactamase superfamily)